MVQREVADRLFAVPATKAYGAVSVLVQLVCERTGFHPVSRTVFRPRPNVDSALVAFRRTGMPPDYPRVKQVVAAAFAHRRKTLPNSARARRDRLPRRSRRGARADRPRAGGARRGAGAAGVRRARRGARMKAPGAREDQPRPRRRPAARRRQARAADRLPAARARRPDPGRALRGRTPRRRLPRGHARPRRARGARRAHRRRRPRGPCGSRSDCRSPPALGGGSSDAATALRLANDTLASAASNRPSCTSSRRLSAPTSRSSSSTARSSAPATARRSSRSTCRRTSGSCSSSRTTRRSRRPPPSTPAFDARDGAAGWDERRAAFLAALDAVRRPRDLAALPPNDLASSPLTDELRGLGAFHADVSGAGPAVYGLFHHRAPAEAAKRALKRAGASWLTAPAWYG